MMSNRNENDLCSQTSITRLKFKTFVVKTLYLGAIMDVPNSINMTAVLDDFLLSADYGRSIAKCCVNKNVNIYNEKSCPK